MTADEQVIRSILSHLEAAWNRGDSAGFAEPFQETAAFIHIFGGELDGRRAVEASHRHIFDTIYSGSRAEFHLRSIRFLRPDVAVVFSEACLTFPSAPERDRVETRPTMVVVKDHGRWRIAAFQNTRISPMPAAPSGAAVSPRA